MAMQPHDKRQAMRGIGVRHLIGAALSMALLAALTTATIPADAAGSWLVVVTNSTSGRIEAGTGTTREKSERYGMSQCKFWSGEDSGACVVNSVCNRAGWAATAKGGAAGGFRFGVSCGLESRAQAVDAAVAQCGKGCAYKEAFKLDGEASGACVPDLNAPDLSLKRGACCHRDYPRKCASGVCVQDDGCAYANCSFHCQ